MQLFVSVLYPFMYVHNMYMYTNVVQIFVPSTDISYLHIIQTCVMYNIILQYNICEVHVLLS